MIFKKPIMCRIYFTTGKTRTIMVYKASIGAYTTIFREEDGSELVVFDHSVCYYEILSDGE